MSTGEEHLPTCRDIVALVTDYLEGSLAPDLRAKFEQHLTWCQGCRNYLEQMRATVQLTGRLSEESIPQQVRDELMRAFRDWRR